MQVPKSELHNKSGQLMDWYRFDNNNANTWQQHWWLETNTKQQFESGKKNVIYLVFELKASEITWIANACSLDMMQ